MKKLFLILLLISNLLLPSICFAVASDMYVTVAGAGSKDGTSWANAGDLAWWETESGTACSSEAGDRYFVEEGTYTLTEAWNCPNDGSSAAPIQIIGVKSGTSNEPPTQSDWAFTTARPLIAAAANTFNFDNGWYIHNLRVTTTATDGIRSDSTSLMYNIKSTNSSGTGGRYAINAFSVTSKTIFCETVSTNGAGIYAYDTSLNLFNYVHDSANGFNGTSLGKHVFIGNVMDTNTDGFNASSGSNLFMAFNVFYNNTTGIDGGSDPKSSIFINNIFDANGTGASWGTSQDNTNFWDYNIWDNTSDTSNVTKGANAITADPGLTDPANGDFTVGSGSNALDAAGAMSENMGVTGSYKWNIGIDQDDVTAAGGATGSLSVSTNF